MIRRQRVRSDLPLRQAPESRIGLSLVTPLSMRVELGRNGIPTNRKELISAALLGLSEDINELRVLINEYRTQTIGDALLPPTQSATVTLVREGPGPRKRT